MKKEKNKEFTSYYISKKTSRKINIKMSKGILKLSKIEAPIVRN